MIQCIAENRPKAERLVTEVVRQVVTAQTIEFEIKNILSGSTKKGSIFVRKSAAEILQICAFLEAEPIEIVFNDLRVPSNLLVVSGNFNPSAPAGRDCWLLWSTIQQNNEKETLLLGELHKVKEEEEDGFGVEVDFSFSELPSDDPRQSDLERPLSRSSQQVFDKSKVIFDQKFNKTDGASVAVPAPRRAAAKSVGNRADISLVIDRMDHVILGITSLFYKHTLSEDSPLINMDDYTKIMLDLGFRASSLSDAVALADGLDNKLFDFPTFLELYSISCGLADSGDRKMTESSFWIPSSTGIWMECDRTTIEQIYKASLPLTVGKYSESEDDFGGSKKRKGKYGEIWVSNDDITEVMRLAGLDDCSDATVGIAIGTMRNYLPGVLKMHPLCLQELLTIYNFILKNRKSLKSTI
jgi:hypothetical protein